MKPLLRNRSDSTLKKLKPLLDEICDQVEQPGFITNDPVSFMHAFEEKRDQEIAGFLAALMAWGRRDIVLRKTEELFAVMEFSPYRYLLTYEPDCCADFRTFRHRTFQGKDIHNLLTALRNIYLKWNSFEEFWAMCHRSALEQGRPLLALFRYHFLKTGGEMPERTLRHIPDPENGSTCKRLAMYLRWCIRKESSVDPGIWSFMDSSKLAIPFDVHVAREGRRLGLLTRRTNDWKAVCNITDRLSELDPADPARYDFALFGIGALGYRLPGTFRLNRNVD